jgi:hypothetical protein
MAQVFHRSFNVISKVSILGFVFIVAGLGWIGANFARSPYSTGVRMAVEQPVPFSHQHHVGLLGIDCRYCHTTVERAAFAGIPSTKICMNCHSQIWVGAPMLEPVRESYRTGRSLEWNRVHRLADFVYFDHSIHVNKGVGCSTCHGRVDEMPLVWQESTLHMDWCLECHREPERFVRPRDRIFDMAWQPPPNQLEMGRKLVEQYKIERFLNCSNCHR